MHLDDLLAAAAENMTNDLRRRLISHPGELGTAREQIIRDFLTAHLPKRFDVSTGFVFDCNGTISSQLDIVIFDSNVCPRFEIPGGKFLFPCEAVAAVGQVKSSLTSRDAFRSAVDNLVSVKSLDRSANGTAFDSRFNECLSPRENHLHQIFTFIFVCGDALEPDTIAQTILEDAFEIAVEHLPNVTIVLDRYLVTYCCDDGVCPNPMAARGVAIQSSDKPYDVFIRFFLLLGQALNVTRTASLPFWEYLSKYQDIPATVHSSCVDSPPPYLGQRTPRV
ncbi:DUF6602 domain-containing protein [uncultured Rubinisphaera sp.]|uniref:DUF6602 domain-containing protein n=1 Tax=uncultured Rubinisphaera sp. TaxID=1678686 RepID=UPI0030DC00DB|tara:strand:- start:48 stop:884 length:837 start_codon:yes stop_codon:yes gene_type:complete